MWVKNVKKGTISAPPYSILLSPQQVIKCDMNMMNYVV